MAIGQAGDLLTVAEAATVLKVSPITIHRWLKQGRLTAYRVGPRAVRISRSELTRLLTPHHAAEASPMPEIGRAADVPVSPPSQTQIDRRLAAIAQAKELRAQMRARRGGAPLASSWQLIRQARDRRASRL
ncbi:MAG TPA: helix-turn-helix domain-containing protein [Chloroflexota bacterium]|nr:helix-turn-helix domain-containing protein [Chloroflexota bacterium]